MNSGIDTHARLSGNSEKSLLLTRRQLQTMQRLNRRLNYALAKRRHGNHTAEGFLIHIERHTNSAIPFPDLTRVIEFSANSIAFKKAVGRLVKFEGDSSNPRGRAQGLLKQV